MKAVILAAGIGSRLGKNIPKCLNELPNGENIIERQIKILKNYTNEIYIVIGFKKNLFLELYPDNNYVINENYSDTNTSKSLLLALKTIKNDDILWLNGDVVFDSQVIHKISKESGNICCVQYKQTNTEEIKFTLDKNGYIDKLNKNVTGLGESVGINKISGKNLSDFIKYLESCENQDYFEKAIENAYFGNIKFKPLDITGYKCIEIDFIEDYKNAWDLFE